MAGHDDWLDFVNKGLPLALAREDYAKGLRAL
jgi:hypothetical protein